MFTLHCNKCGHDWVGQLSLEIPCPNCHTLHPFLEMYRAEDLKPLRPSIYDATPLEKLEDLKRTVEAALFEVREGVVKYPIAKADMEEVEGAQFAIGNWIISPRF